jgi:hypothetical protein
VRREAPTLVCEAMSAQNVERYNEVSAGIMAGPGVYRRGYRTKRDRS